MILKFNLSKLTIVFKIALIKPFDNGPKIKILSLSIHYFKKHIKPIRGICQKILVNLNKQ